MNDTEASHPSMGQMGIEATPPSLEMTGTVTIDNIFRHNCNCDNHMRAVTTSSIKAEHKPPTPDIRPIQAMCFPYKALLPFISLFCRKELSAHCVQ